MVKKCVLVCAPEEQDLDQKRGACLSYAFCTVKICHAPPMHALKCDLLFCTTRRAFLIDQFIFMKSLIKPGDWYRVQTDGWPLFSKEKLIYSWTWQGGKQHFSVVGVLLSMLWLHLCFSLDSSEMVWLCLHSPTDFIGPDSSRPVANPCHRTGWSLLARNPERPSFPECLRDPVKWMTRTQRAWSRPGQQEGEREPHQVAVLLALAGSSLHSDYHQWQHSSAPSLLRLRCPHLKPTSNLWRDVWGIPASRRMQRNKDRWCKRRKFYV